MRISSAFAAALLLAACTKGADGQATAANGHAGAEADDRLACALAGARDFSDSCTIERASQEGAPILVVHHPDGGFHRFEIMKDGGLAVADGAQQAQVQHNGGTIEVTLGADRYRIPATVTGDAARP